MVNFFSESNSFGILYDLSLSRGPLAILPFRPCLSKKKLEMIELGESIYSVESFVDICYKVIRVNHAVSQISQGLRRFELLLIASSICLSDAVSSGNSVFK